MQVNKCQKNSEYKHFYAVLSVKQFLNTMTLILSPQVVLAEKIFFRVTLFIGLYVYCPKLSEMCLKLVFVFY